MSAFAASRAPQVLNENSETSEDIDGSIADLTPENNDEERYLTKSAHFMDISLSTWSPTNENVWMITERAVGIRMKQGETATFIGQYEIKVRKGMVSIYGAWLTVDGLTQRVFAPSTHALPPIACMSQEAEIVLMSCRRTMRHLSRVSPLYRNIWNQSWGQADAPKLASALRTRSFEFLQSSNHDNAQRSLYPLKTDHAWTRVQGLIARSAKVAPPKIMVCGAKGTGKSTFAKLLTNHLLTATLAAQGTHNPMFSEPATIAWIDLDPGQPEFSPPGQLSLVQIRSPVLGPSFSHSGAVLAGYRTVRAHAVTATSPKEDPLLFMECFKDLIREYSDLVKTFRNCSLIINCPGWINSYGLELHINIIKSSGANDLVFMGGEKAYVTKALRDAAGRMIFHELPSPSLATPSLPRTSAQSRSMQTISYFHQDQSGPVQPRWFTTPIDERRPWILNIAQPNADILGMILMGDYTESEISTEMLEGTLAALCMVDKDYDCADTMRRVNHLDFGTLPIWLPKIMDENTALNPRKSRMLSLTLIQEVDIAGKRLKLQMPMVPGFRRLITQAASGGRLLLVLGRYECPGWAYTEGQLFSQYQKRRMVKKSGQEEDLSTGEEVLSLCSSKAIGDDYAAPFGGSWIKMGGRGDTAGIMGQRWRVRRDIGRSREKQNSSATAAST